MACWTTRSVTVGMPGRRLPPAGLGISTLRTACGRYRPSLICSRSAGQCARAWAGQSSMVTPSMHGAPWLDLTRCHARARLSLASTAASRFFIASSWFKARCAAAAGASSPVGVGDAFEVVTGCSLCLVVRPFGRPTPGSLLWRLLASASSRRALPHGALRCRWWLLPIHRMRRAARRSAWTLITRCGPLRKCHPRRAARGADLPR